MARKSAEQPPRIGSLINQLRRARNLTLEEFAIRSGVSKSMLSQIERNATNPTIATAWRLAAALDLQIEDLLRNGDRAPTIDLVPAHGVPGVKSADGKCRLRILAPLALAGQIEWYELLAEPSGLWCLNRTSPARSST